jgi:hypothetical protein
MSDNSPDKIYLFPNEWSQVGENEFIASRCRTGKEDIKYIRADKVDEYKKIIEKLKAKLQEDIRCENDDYNNGYHDACDEIYEYIEQIQKELEG